METDTFVQVNAAFPWFFPSVVFVFGACIGSFLNVVIYRLPAGRSLSRPGSTCACGRAIAWYDNVPILGWLWLRGRARCCGQRVSVRYPFVELLTAALFWAAWMAHPPLVALVAMLFVAWMLAPAFIDLDTMEIPDRFSIGGFVLGVFVSILVPALHGFGGDLWLLDSLRSALTAIAGGFIASALILWVALLAEVMLRKEAMGFGDVKLMGAIGAFCGWQGGVFALFGGAILGCFGFLLAMLWGGARQKAVEAEDEDEEEEEEEGEEEDLAGRIPFGPALAAAAVLYLVWLQPWVDAYFASFSDVLFRR
jgi:leader peptidase (prepilin peptidase)/N-methyltransferase